MDAILLKIPDIPGQTALTGFEDQIQVAVVLDDDPGRDLGLLRQPGHRFFFRLNEVEEV